MEGKTISTVRNILITQDIEGANLIIIQLNGKLKDKPLSLHYELEKLSVEEIVRINEALKNSH